MNKPILGKDVLIAFDTTGTFSTYFCATDLEISFQMETKKTKTIGDGVWERKRGQSKSATISLGGVAIISETLITSFNLLDYYNNMVDIPFAIIFTDSDSDTKVIVGEALVTSVDMSGGSEGHAAGSFTLEVNGPVDIRDELVPCGSAISSVSYEGEISVQNFKIFMAPGSGLITRFDYTMDGGGIQSLFTDVGGTKNVYIDVPGALSSAHQLKISPVCDNGYSGPEFTFDFSKHL